MSSTITPTPAFYDIGVEGAASPADPLPDLPEVERGGFVVVSGRAPVWRYARAFHLLHGSRAGAIGVFDPKLGAVVVASHRPDLEEGQVVEVE